MKDTAKLTLAQAISKTHVPYGLVALARAGISLEDGVTYVRYKGTREAMVRMGVLTENQLPGCGFIHTKGFENHRGQSMQVHRRGKSRVEVFVRTGTRPTCRDDIDLFEFQHTNGGREASKVGMLAILHAAMRPTCQREVA